MEKEYLEGLVGPEAAAEIYDRHQKELGALRLDHALTRAVDRAGGRSAKAIRALMDEQALAGAEDVDAAAGEAVAQLKRENPWLFVTPQVSSPGTGAMTVTRTPTMEDVGKMSMAEYRRYRQSR